MLAALPTGHRLLRQRLRQVQQTILLVCSFVFLLVIIRRYVLRLSCPLFFVNITFSYIMLMLKPIFCGCCSTTKL